MARDVGRKGIGEIIYLYLNLNFLRHKIVEWPRGLVRRCSILDIKEMISSRNDYLPTRIADMKYPQVQVLVETWHNWASARGSTGTFCTGLSSVVVCFNKAEHTAYHVIQHFHSQQYDQKNSAGICPSMDLEENIHTSLVPKISKLRSKKELSDCHRGKKNKQTSCKIFTLTKYCTIVGMCRLSLHQLWMDSPGMVLSKCRIKNQKHNLYGAICILS